MVRFDSSEKRITGIPCAPGAAAPFLIFVRFGGSVSRIVRSVYPPLGVPNMRTELNYPGDESLKLWSQGNFEDARKPRSAIPAVKSS